MRCEECGTCVAPPTWKIKGRWKLASCPLDDVHGIFCRACHRNTDCQTRINLLVLVSPITIKRLRMGTYIEDVLVYKKVYEMICGRSNYTDIRCFGISITQSYENMKSGMERKLAKLSAQVSLLFAVNEEEEDRNRILLSI